MDKRFGVEKLVGLGGGLVSPASQKATEKAASLCRQGRSEEAVPYLEEAIKDPNNLDAHIEIAFLSANDPKFAIQVLETTSKRGRKIMLDVLGPQAFADAGPYVGHFHEIPVTRPYMRVLQAQARLYVEIDQAYGKAAAVIIEMLRLCPGDNMGQRTWLGALLLHTKRYADTLYFSQIWLDSYVNSANSIPVRGGTDFKPPEKGVVAAARTTSDWVPAVHLYNAALAAFRLYGPRSEEAREYLTLAARANAHILTKILAGAEKPSSLNNSPRQPNGPEEAQDYRWLTQELWTTPDVLRWIQDCMKHGTRASGAEGASEPTLRDAVLKKCGDSSCGNQETKALEYKRCAGCHLISYCSAPCQKADWPNHKSACKERTQLKLARKGLMKGKGNVTDMPVFAMDMAGGVPVLYNGSTKQVLPMPFPPGSGPRADS
uniref:MYND-type domain-containing protein n=1 Tax=Mycena chlorophos TaxID=658473 RepID=A0ABQ0L433_MYCCL|nr:predicted protein [Mycena chlorophos]